MSTTLAPVENGRQLAATVQNADSVMSGDIVTNPAMFDHVQRLAKLLSHGAFTPKHLKRSSQEETVATCFRVAAQAIRWGFDPFAVADETYEVHGRLGYQGKLITAVVNSRAGLKDRLSFKYEGTGGAMKVEVSGTFKNESEPRTVTLSVAQAKTTNEMWTKDPEQKLAYSGAIKWARRHCPEVVMGVQTIEDLEAIAESESQPARRRVTVTTLDSLADKVNGDSAATLSDDALLAWEAKFDECETSERVDWVINQATGAGLTPIELGRVVELGKTRRAQLKGGS